MFAIGVFVGIIGFLVKSATGIIFEQKYKLVEHFIEEGGFVWVCASVKSGHNRCQGKKYCMPIATLCILAMGVETNKHIKIHENVSNLHISQVWLSVAAIDISLVLVSTTIVVFIAPAASGSGIPEVIGFLNGASLRKIFNISECVRTAIAVTRGWNEYFWIGLERKLKRES